MVVGRNKGEPLIEVPSVRVRAGRGIEGDRYFKATPYGDASRDLTLIESEALEALWREHGIRLKFVEARRNVVTLGVGLEALIGRRFSVGAVQCIGIKTCAPCLRLQQLTFDGVLRGLAHSGGVRAAILNDGEIQVGDAVTFVR